MHASMVLSNTSAALKGNDSKHFLCLFIHLLVFDLFPLTGKLFSCNCCWLAVWDWKDVCHMCDGQFVHSVQHVPLSSSFLFLASVCLTSQIHSNLSLALTVYLQFCSWGNPEPHLETCISSFQTIVKTVHWYSNCMVLLYDYHIWLGGGSVILVHVQRTMGIPWYISKTALPYCGTMSKIAWW